jgi:lipopolysaccharide export system permease protein
MVLTRWYKDSEMVIWQSAGISLFKILRPIVNFTIPLSLVIGSLSLFVAPWANEQTITIKQRFQQRDDISMLAPGQFRESSGNNRVFFIERINQENDTFNNIFVTDFGKDRQLIAVSKEGYIENTESGERHLVLNAGRRYEGTPGHTDFRITEFNRYTVKLEGKKIDPIINSPKGMSTMTLIKHEHTNNPDEILWLLGELLWRIGLPIMAIALAIIAIPLSYTDPRRGRYYSLILAVLIYFTYSNLLKLMEAWVHSAKISFAVGVWLLHIIAISLGVLFIYYRENRSITLYNRYQRWINRNKVKGVENVA